MMNYIDETWKVIDFIEGIAPIYEISNYGRVRNIKKGNILQQRNIGEYKGVMLCTKSKEKQVYIHRLVAIAFLPNIDNKPFVNHINEDKSNNHVSNLEWVTRWENNNHGTRNKRISDKVSKPIVVFNTDWEFVSEYNSISKASKELEVDQGNISKCCRGTLTQVKGYIFKYKADEEVINECLELIG